MNSVCVVSQTQSTGAYKHTHTQTQSIGHNINDNAKKSNAIETKKKYEYKKETIQSVKYCKATRFMSYTWE